MGKSNKEKEEPRKPYEKPALTKLNREQVKLKLVDRAAKGDQTAKNILQMMFPEEATKLLKSKKKSA